MTWYDYQFSSEKGAKMSGWISEYRTRNECIHYRLDAPIDAGWRRLV